jgi:hypothetical protein
VIEATAADSWSIAELAASAADSSAVFRAIGSAGGSGTIVASDIAQDWTDPGR